MHSVSLEPTTLISIGTRTTYQPTGDAGMCNLDVSEFWLVVADCLIFLIDSLFCLLKVVFFFTDDCFVFFVWTFRAAGHRSVHQERFRQEPREQVALHCGTKFRVVRHPRREALHLSVPGPGKLLKHPNKNVELTPPPFSPKTPPSLQSRKRGNILYRTLVRGGGEYVIRIRTHDGPRKSGFPVRCAHTAHFVSEYYNVFLRKSGY